MDTRRELDPELGERLAAAVGRDHVVTDPDVRAGHEVDWTGRWRGRALAVVRPASTDEVAAVVRACRAAGVALVPQGGNTGLVGGGVPRPEGDQVVLSTARLRAVGEVDRAARQLLVGAGVTLEAAQAAAAAAGFEVGIDLAARASCTVGGMVATNAGGIHVVRNGTMRARAAGVEAVLADGSVIRRLSGLPKDAAGYDLTGLLVGSEGTLGVVTRVLLALVPRPVERITAALGVGSLAEAVAVVGRLAARLPGLEAAEVCFADGIDLVERQLGVPPTLPERPPVTLVVEAGAWSDAAAGVLAEEMAAAVAACPEVGATAVATEEATRARLWEGRERHTEAIATLGVPHKLDVGVPLARLAAFEADVRDRVAAVAPGATCVLFGHVGDGNLHVNVVGPDPGDETVDAAVLEVTARHGGTISSEHGVGVAKRPFLELTRSPEEVAAMRAIKAALDPGGLLNPGVLFGG
ncbi:MAG TPA: FAD-binding oxidoreductase [Acidimicrobiales bacterium]